MKIDLANVASCEPMKQHTKFISHNFIYIKFKTTKHLTIVFREACLGSKTRKKNKLMTPMKSSTVVRGGGEGGGGGGEQAYGRICGDGGILAVDLGTMNVHFMVGL